MTNYLKIGLLSDTHSHLETSIFNYFESCDEIWHAGDIGNQAVIDELTKFKPFRAVYGNIDDANIRTQFPENLIFDCAGIKVFMTHIGGYPGRYNVRVKKIIQAEQPKLYICGHSHILKIMPDKKFNLLHINPGAAGNHGFHKVKTIVRFEIEDGKLQNLEVVELGKRGAIH